MKVPLLDLRAQHNPIQKELLDAIAQVLTMLLIIIVSLCSAPPTPERVQPFLWRLNWLRAKSSFHSSQ